MKIIKNLLLICSTFTFTLLFAIAVKAADADSLAINITNSNGASVADMIDNSYNSMSTFNTGDTIKITSDTDISGLYIVWNNKKVSPWTLTYGSTTKECGQNGYLHEYVKLDSSSKEVTMNVKADGMKICKIFALSEGKLPSWVQDWNAPCDKADILLLSTHADDEQLFFGGIIPYYAGELNLKVQVAYYANFWNSAPIREHEKLDGLWVVGVENYPVNGEFDDIYAKTLEGAKQVYNYDASIAYVTEIIRKFKPLVLVGQDLNGEYGHGGHMLTASAITDAIQLSNDSTKYPESAATYGTYDVPKTYLHLYAENQVNLDCQRVMNNFNGKTVLATADEGYKMHASQQWCWFYVSDNYEYSCARFGLYRSTVGNDVNKNDILENLVTYEEQDRIAAEEASKEAESESIRDASIAASEEAAVATSAATKVQEKNDSAVIKTVVIVLSIILIILIIALISSSRRKKRL